MEILTPQGDDSTNHSMTLLCMCCIMLPQLWHTCIIRYTIMQQLSNLTPTVLYCTVLVLHSWTEHKSIRFSDLVKCSTYCSLPTSVGRTLLVHITAEIYKHVYKQDFRLYNIPINKGQHLPHRRNHSHCRQLTWLANLITTQSIS